LFNLGESVDYFVFCFITKKNGIEQSINQSFQAKEKVFDLNDFRLHIEHLKGLLSTGTSTQNLGGAVAVD